MFFVFGSCMIVFMCGVVELLFCVLCFVFGGCMLVFCVG